MAKNDYNADSIQAVQGIPHVRMFPSMYLGDNGAMAIQQAIKEVVTNSVDEYIGGNGNKVIINLIANDRVSIEDFGRGIPCGVNSLTGKTGLEMCVGEINAGGKYGKDSYKISGGMYGIGVSATNAISSNFEVEVNSNDGNVYFCRYEKGVKVLPKKTGELSIIGEHPKNKTGTKITFTPDASILEVTNFDIFSINMYLRQLCYLVEGLELVFHDSRNPKNIITNTYKSNNGLVEFIETNLKETERAQLIPEVIHFKGTYNDTDAYDIAFTYNKGFDLDSFLYVNKNAVINGGTPVTGFRMGIAKAINEMAKLLGIMKEKERPLKVQDIEEGLIMMMSLSLKEPALEGQTKNKLNGANLVGLTSNATYDFLMKFFEENPLVLGIILEKCLSGRRGREAAQRARVLVQEKSTSKFVSSSTKLKDCSSKNNRDREIMLVEGDSAAGGIGTGRNVETQAYYPLRGKVLNVLKAKSKIEAMKNSEIYEMINIFGCGHGETFDINKLRYHKIIIFTDADPDGAHITCLLLTFFHTFLRELIEHGYVYVLNAPLFKVTHGKDKVTYLKNAEELKNWQDMNSGKKIEVNRLKGLGEMQDADLAYTCLDINNRDLVQVTLDDAEMIIRKLMSSDTTDDRKIFYKSKGTII